MTYKTGIVGQARIVLKSSPASVAAGSVSLLAIFEVAAASLLAWSYAFYESDFRFVSLAIILAPILLLRSPQSTQLGVELFERFARRHEHSGDADLSYDFRSLFFWLAAFSAVTFPAAAVMLAHSWLDQLDGVKLFLYGTVFIFLLFIAGFSVTSAIMVILTNAKTPKEHFWTYALWNGLLPAISAGIAGLWLSWPCPASALVRQI